MKKIKHLCLLFAFLMSFSSCDILQTVPVQSTEGNSAELSAPTNGTELEETEAPTLEEPTATAAITEAGGAPAAPTAPVTDSAATSEPLPPATHPSTSEQTAPSVTASPTEEPKPQSEALSELIGWLETVSASNVERVRESHEKNGARAGDQTVHYFVNDLTGITNALNGLRNARATKASGSAPAGETVRYTVYLKSGESHSFSVTAGVYRRESGEGYTVEGLPSLRNGLRSFSYVTYRPWDVYAYVGNSIPTKLCSLPDMNEMDFMEYVPHVTDKIPQSRMSFYLVTDVSWLRIYIYSEKIFWVEDIYGNKAYYRAMGSWNFYELIEEYGNVSVYPLGR